MRRRVKGRVCCDLARSGGVPGVRVRATCTLACGTAPACRPRRAPASSENSLPGLSKPRALHLAPLLRFVYRPRPARLIAPAARSRLPADPALLDAARALRAEFNTTFVMHNEDHTLGNALRMMLNQNPKVSVA